ncbi:hypothetical protein [Fulvivirga sedimenti]|uniref:Uncharacterized protein n=1 Tax=Fulvivirga sedimenti TaxID=2879465 RepID=A0A9X1HWB2_9BACT|nr:hypothetical protein [Fulvivirga sedimenti]MCA6077967.1 hypothetical protein [Fulvivirga sedimenti]
MMNLIKRIVLTICLLLSANSFAHVGSPGVVYEGKAGPYQLMVSISPPDVIPGTANIQIYVENGVVDEIWVKPIYWYAGDEGSPSPDPALPVPDSPGQYQGIVWLMSSGTASLEIEVKGPDGEGKALIPLMAAATAQKEMEPGLGWVLAILGILLVILMATIIGSSVSDALLPPGKESSLRGRRIRGITISLGLMSLILYGGASWWNSWADNYKRYMYEPFKAESSIVSKNGKTVMEFMIDPNYREYRGNTLSPAYMIPDHGKLMHMFVMREGTLDAFAHLHPHRKDSLTYETNWPPLPKGRYFVFADIVRAHGFQETIVDTLVVESEVTPEEWDRMDSDDTFIRSNPVESNDDFDFGSDVIVCGKPGVRTPLPDGSTAIWEYDAAQPLKTGTLYPMTFNILNPDGEPAELEPYMGMMGHMVVMKYDGSVYIHLHPVGSYSTASQEIMDTRIAGSGRPGEFSPAPVFMDSVDNEVERIASLTEEERNDYLSELMNHDIESDGEHEGHSVVTFPYVFPEAGDYRIWIQMKRNGQVLNTAFDATVVE